MASKSESSATETQSSTSAASDTSGAQSSASSATLLRPLALHLAALKELKHAN